MEKRKSGREGESERVRGREGERERGREGERERGREREREERGREGESERGRVVDLIPDKLQPEQPQLSETPGKPE